MKKSVLISRTHEFYTERIYKNSNKIIPKNLLQLLVIILLVSCSNENFDDTIIEEQQEITNNDSIATGLHKKAKIKRLVPVPAPVPSLVCKPNHYDILLAISTIAENDYSFFANDYLDFAGDALQNSFLLQNLDSFSLENKDVFVIGSEGLPPGFQEATSGITPFEFKYNDFPQEDIFGNITWNWVQSESGGSLSGVNVTDIYLSAIDKIQEKITATPSYNRVNKIKIDIEFEFSGAVKIKFFVWFN